MRRTRRRQHRGLSALQALSLHDWTLLALLAFLGLVAVRIVVILAFMFSSCAEDFASFGMGPQNPAIPSIWEVFYLSAWLAATYALAVILASKSAGFVHTIFRSLCLCGFLLLAQGMRLMISEDAMRPDGYLHVDRLAMVYDDLGAINEDFVTFNWAQAIWAEPADFRTACVYLDRGTIVFPKQSMHRNWSQLYSPYQLGFGGRGRLIDALELGESIVVFNEEDRALIEARMRPWLVAHDHMPHPKQLRDAPDVYWQAWGLAAENSD